MDMQSRWLDQQHEQQVALNNATVSNAEQVQLERAGWLDQLRTWFQSTQSQQNQLQDLNDRIEKIISIMFEQTRTSSDYREQIRTDQVKLVELTQSVNQMMILMGQRAKDEMSSRSELIHEMRMTQSDQQERHEQLLTTLITRLSADTSVEKPPEIQQKKDEAAES
jgi:hypothetical protein